MSILKITSPQELKSIHPISFHRGFTPREIRHLLEVSGAMWLRPDHPRAPHIGGLASGRHRCTDGYIDMSHLLSWTPIALILARQVVASMRVHYKGPLDWVVGPTHAGATLTNAIATQLGIRHEFTEKRVDPNGKERQAWRSLTIGPEEIVLLGDDLFTRGSTIERSEDSILAAHDYPIQFAPVVVAVVRRSSFLTVRERRMVCLLHVDMHTWTNEGDDMCPLCKGGQSERVTDAKSNLHKLIAWQP